MEVSRENGNRVLHVKFELMSPDFERVDVIAMAHCLIAGIPKPVPIQVVRISPTEIKYAFPVQLDSDGAPNWLEDLGLREEIQERVAEALSEAVEREERGESGAATLLGVDVMTTSQDLHKRGIIGAAAAFISTEPDPIPLMLMVGAEDRLHVVFAARFGNFMLPMSLQYPSMRKAIKDAIYRG
ncbi:MAG: hypothetical protein IPJ77_07305 [Planctomycetes bacterium]|nr:hypothetical protein [Planctomycetota bacterium]